MSEKDPANKLLRPSRREFLANLTAAGGALAAGSASGALVEADSVQHDPTRRMGSPPDGLGERSRFETLERMPIFGIVSATPLERLHGSITPSDLHFERHHAGIPDIDPAQHTLLLHGMVERALKFSLDDLKRLPSVTRSCFIECSGNMFTDAGEQSTPQTLCGLTSHSEWTGVALSTLLREAGLKPKASWCLAEGSDAALMTRSIPVAKLLDDAILAYAQNGEALRPAQGYPMRLVLPGWEGNTHIKWLRRLEFSDSPSMTREETSKYTDPLKDGTARQFSVVMDARSVITSPTYPSTLEPGWQEIRGIAWSGRGKISAVEVSADGGRKWQQARLQTPVLSKAHTRFSLPWRWDGKRTEIASRAIDETAYIQPTYKQLRRARGELDRAYHVNPILHWIIEPEGRVIFKTEH